MIMSKYGQKLQLKPLSYLIKFTKGVIEMSPPSTLGLFSMLITIGVPASIVFLLIWVNQIKRNLETQVEQNKEIIRLLQKERTE
jgi:hypothetical protein